jgi:protein-tyrosine phosphatase
MCISNFRRKYWKTKGCGVPKSILFVCTGNICRSPTAEGVFRHALNRAKRNMVLDSAGTHSYHIGEPPDRRSIAAAQKRGVDISNLRARKVQAADFENFDIIYGMDEGHVDILQRLCPPQHAHKVQLMLETLGHPYVREVPDPYYGGIADFNHVLDLVEWAADAVVSQKA